MTTLLKDLRYAGRMLIRHPSFTIIAVVTLGLGIGVNTAIFSVVNMVLLRALPFSNPDRLVTVGLSPTSEGLPGIASFEYLAWSDKNQSFENIAAHSDDNYNVTGLGEPERVRGGKVTGSFFSTLGINAIRGRVFLAEEDSPAGNQVVILSEGFWQRRFNRSESALGSSLTLNNKSYTVIGVAPDSLRFPSKYDIWLPMRLDRVKETTSDMISLVEVVGRLKAGITPAQAQAELKIISQHTFDHHHEKLPLSTHEVTPLHQFLVAGVRQTILVLWGAVGLVMLLACANVANLMLSRTVSRQREMAVRSAVGARRWQLVRQLLTESVLLAVAGGLLGIVIAMWSKGLLASLVPAGFTSAVHNLGEARLDWKVFGFTLLLSVVTGVLFGLAPALTASKPDLVSTLRESSISNLIGFGLRSVRGWLVVAELAFAIVLLVGAGLLVRSFNQLLSVDLGFAPEGVLTARVDLPRSTYSSESQVQGFFEQLIGRLQAIPGVQSVGMINHTPLSGFGIISFMNIEGYGQQDREKDDPIGVGMASTDYFRTLKIPLLKGRMIDDRDRKQGIQVALVNEAFAKRFFGSNEAIGKRVSFNCNDDLCRTIVGVVGNVRQEDLTSDAVPQVYLPYAQMPMNGMNLFVRTASDPSSIASAVRSEVFAIDKNQPIYEVQALDTRVAEAVSVTRSLMMLFSAFAALALLLSLVGIYGVVSYSVTQRTREIGIRIALGARGADVLGMIVRSGIVLAVTGIGVGLFGAYALTRFMTALLFEVTPTDVSTYVFVSIGLFVVAVVACLIPARRAMKVDPIVALRCE